MRVDIANELLAKWQDYCERNWLSPKGNDIFCPENRVKLFLNGVAYFLLVGNTEGIVTDYKDIEYGKREIPISSCPSFIEDKVYGCGAQTELVSEEQSEGFHAMLNRLDEKGGKTKPSKKTNGHKLARREKINRIRANLGPCKFACVPVDTEGVFIQDGNKYVVKDCDRYLPKQTANGLLYDMDHVWCVTAMNGCTMFYDMDMDEVPSVEKINFSEVKKSH